MAHAFALGRGPPGDIGRHRLFHIRANVLGRFFLAAAANFADQDHGFSLWVGLEHPQAVDEIQPLDRVTANADTG